MVKALDRKVVVSFPMRYSSPSSSLRTQAISSCEHPQRGWIFACMTVFFIPPQGQPYSDFGEVHAGCVSVAGTDINSGYQRQDLLSPSLIFDACALRLDLGLYSHPKE